MIERAMRDLRQAYRGVRARPVHAAAAVGTIALVIAANGALFAAINATFFRPLPLSAGDDTVVLYTMPPGVTDAASRNPLHEIDLVRFRAASRHVTDVSAYSIQERVIGGSGEPEVVRVAAANAGLFRLLRDRPLLGRAFTEDEEARKAAHVVLAYGLWQRRYGGDREILGRVISLNGSPHTVVGVMPQTFPPRFLDAEALVPLGITTAANTESNRTYLPTLARLVPGTSLRQADEEMRGLMRALAEEFPFSHRGWTAGVITFRDWQYRGFRAPLFVLFVAMTVLLLMAASNLAGLSLAHVTARSRELVLRRALGASRASVVRLIFSEVLILNAAGAALGVAAAAALLPALLAIDPAATRALGAISIDWRVVAYAGLSALAASCLASLVPAMHAVDVSRTAPRLGAGARAHGSRSGHHTRAVLLVAQTALSLVLLAGGALLLRAVAASAALAPGYDPSNVLTAQVRLSPERHATAETRVAIVQRLLDRIREIPGVVSASTVLNDFRPGFSFVTLVDIEHQPTPDGSAHTVQFRRVSPGYFTTMRIREIQGRTFTDQDTEATLASAVVSRSFAARFWPGADPIGRRVQRAKRWHTVIGVVDDVSDVDLLQAPAPTIYVSWTQSNAAVSPVALVIRTAHDPASVAPAVRASVSALDPLMPVDRIQPLDVFLADSLAPQRFRATMLTALAVVGLLLGAIGIFGTTARTIAERWGELGVRLALGGERFALWRGAIAAQLKLVAIGVAVGALLAGVLGAALASLLPEVGVVDWIAVAGAAGALVVTAAVAAAVPALRILRLNPLEVLRG